MNIQRSRINVLDRSIDIAGKYAGRVAVIAVVDHNQKRLMRSETEQPEESKWSEDRGHVPNAENPTGWFPRGIHLDHIREDY